MSTATTDKPATETVSTTNTDNPNSDVSEVFTQSTEPKSYFELVAARNRALSSKSPQLSPKSAEPSPKSAADASWKSSYSTSPKSVDKSGSSDSNSPHSAINTISNSKVKSTKLGKGEKTKIDVTSVWEAARRDAKFSSGKSKGLDAADDTLKKSPQPLDDSDPEQAISPNKASNYEGTMATKELT